MNGNVRVVPRSTFEMVEVMVVVHLIFDVVVTVVVAVERGMREEQAQDIVSGAQVDKAVGVGLAG